MKVIKSIFVILVFFGIYYLLDIWKKKRAEQKKKDDISTLKINRQFIFDKAIYHMSAVNSLNLDELQAYVHSGFFISWIIKNSHFVKKREELKKYHELLIAKEKSPIQYYLDNDGVFIGDFMSNDCYKFSMEYFNIENGMYLIDYQSFLGANESVYNMKCDWSNFEKVDEFIEKKFQEWLIIWH